MAARRAHIFSKHWADFLGRINEAREELGYSRSWERDEVCYFRGLANADWALLPSLYRHKRFGELKRNKAARDDYFWQLESDIYFEFNARAREMHGVGLSSWDVLFFMQHHGAPTRLLDWTEVFGVGLHFALSDLGARDENEACIWLLNPFHLNAFEWNNDIAKGEADLIDPKSLGWDRRRGEYWGYDEILVEDGLFEFEMPCAIYPELRSARIQAQRGSFTIFGDGYKPLDELFPPEKKRQKVLRKVVLPSEARSDAEYFLTLAGIDHHLLFPELDGLAKSLRQKTGF
jgi:hypothetical protein